MSHNPSQHTRFTASKTEHPRAAARRAALAAALAGVTAMSLLSGCPTQGNLGNLTFEQTDDGPFDRTLDGEAGDSFLDTGIWADGATLRVRVDTEDANAALPSLDCAVADQTIFTSTMEGVDIVNIAAVGDGITQIECHDTTPNAALVDYISIAAAPATSLRTLVRVPAPVSRVSLDLAGAPLQIVEAGTIDVALEMLDGAGGHLRGNIPVDSTTTDAAVAALLVDQDVNPDVLSNQFFLVSGPAVGAATIDAALSTDAAVTGSIDVVVVPVTDVYALEGHLVDGLGAELDPAAVVDDGTMVWAEAFLGDSSEAFGGAFVFTVLTPGTIALVEPILGAPSANAKLISVTASGPASLTIELPGSAAPILQLDFMVQAN